MAIDYWEPAIYTYGWDSEDHSEDISYSADYDIDVAFEVKIQGGDWVDIEPMGEWFDESLWIGDYNEKLIDKYDAAELLINAIGDEIEKDDKLTDGNYLIKAHLDFYIDVTNLFRLSDGSIYDDDIETYVSPINISKLKVERLN